MKPDLLFLWRVVNTVFNPWAKAHGYKHKTRQLAGWNTGSLFSAESPASETAKNVSKARSRDGISALGRCYHRTACLCRIRQVAEQAGFFAQRCKELERLKNKGQ